ncbi:hypothetical protein LTR62_004398 [Meristemomyces frigidus]|uniref:Uncharacterized protein n=1 Tax=Meristemomyces frigidus TaxID=1508187 RepID=A0AAN7THM8_9PEZI|nr:hypothetical protein LTR62_004398 [Meristemomyces frigidus]
METLSPYPSTPRSQVSDLRHRTAPRVMQTSDARTAATETYVHQPLSASQESVVSARSDGSSLRQPHLQSSSSNLSQLTNDTDPTSPAIPAPQPQHEQQSFKTGPMPTYRAITPEDEPQSYSSLLASPQSVLSPASTNGAKRTASGHVKNAPSLPNTPMTANLHGRRSRAESISSTGSRAGELAATLKSRLGYAMAKVQHGWEHKNIMEIQQIAAQDVSQRYSMSHVDHSKRPVSAGLSYGTERMSMYENYGPLMYDSINPPPSKRRSGNFSTFMASPQQPRHPGSNTPHLQPPADIRSVTSQQHYYSAPSTQQIGYNNAMSPPRTPMNGHPRRPPTIRTDTQTAEAERDALQALFQLGSPHTSQVSRNTNASQTSSNQESPLRNEFPTPRRVTFARSVSEASSARGSSASNSAAER